MKVKEVIEKLMELHPEANVWIQAREYCEPLKGVYIAEGYFQSPEYPVNYQDVVLEDVE